MSEDLRLQKKQFKQSFAGESDYRLSKYQRAGVEDKENNNLRRINLRQNEKSKTKEARDPARSSLQ